MGIPVKRGRTFTVADDSLAPQVAVISESMARKFWPGLDPIGHTFTSMAPAPFTIVGVVADVRERRLDSDPTPQMYFPIAEVTPANVAIVVRSTLPPAALLARMQESVRSTDPKQAVYNVRMIDDVVGSSVAPRRTNTILISAFAALALLLTAIGLAAGIAGAWALSKVLTSMIYGVSVHDPWTFTVAPLVLVVPVVVAAFVPARRAARGNPVEVMRAD